MNRVIVLGADHINTLGVIRTFGENNIMVDVYLVSNTNMVSIKKSRYINKIYICRDEEMALLYLQEKEQNNDEKLVIIPTTDKFVALLDTNYKMFSKNFYIYNINKKDNEILKYMDKYNQFLLMNKNNISCAKSEIIKLPYDGKIEGFNFPVIIKPLKSIDGKKNDIVIVEKENDVYDNIKELEKYGYTQVLMQEFLEYDFECDITGCCINDKIYIPGIIKKHRIWPVKRGSTTYGEMIKKDFFDTFIKEIENLMKSIKYTGLFNIEFFVSGDKCYLNEINFRNSAISYGYGKMSPIIYYYNEIFSLANSSLANIENNYFIIDDLADIHNVVDGIISFRKYKEDKRKSYIKLTYNKNDKKVYYKMFLYKLLKNVKLFKFLTYFSKIIHKREKTYLMECELNNVTNMKIIDDYQIIDIDKTNYHLLEETEEFNNMFLQGFNKNNIKAIVLKKDDRIIGKAFYKSCGATDPWIKIKSKNSYLITNIHINPEYRGLGYQKVLIYEIKKELMSTNNNTNLIKLYGVVYNYNIPSYKNFLAMGFKVKDNFQLIRFCKKSINKRKV